MRIDAKSWISYCILHLIRRTKAQCRSAVLFPHHRVWQAGCFTAEDAVKAKERGEGLYSSVLRHHPRILRVCMLPSILTVRGRLTSTLRCCRGMGML